MIQQLQNKFETATNRDDKIKILSVLPKSWNADKIASAFNVSIYIAKKTKDLVDTNGILCGVKKKIGSRTLSNDTVKIVQDFYRSDEVSRMCPGLREFVTVTNEGEKKSIQRRLILMNLKEAYVKFKDDEQSREYRIGFSKFAELRPRECVLALEKYGTKTHFIYCSNDDYQSAFIKLTGLYDRVRTIEGTQSMHSFIPIGKTELDVRRYSDCGNSMNVKLIR